MLYDRIQPDSSLSRLIDCYWVVEDDNPAIRKQKIIPDGYPEVIFHYGDPYRINISGTWEIQSRQLLAGQIRNHFYLQNTGRSGMIGIKFKPAALSLCYGLDMSVYTDRVVDLAEVPATKSLYEKLSPVIGSEATYLSRIKEMEEHFIATLHVQKDPDSLIENTLRLIFESSGQINVSELCSTLDTGERKLERLFRQHIGLPPKFYTRIIRFNHIFRLLQEKKYAWSELAQLTGFYDQSHFIKNFKEFTGEDPSAYFFEEPNMANFFLKRAK